MWVQQLKPTSKQWVYYKVQQDSRQHDIQGRRDHHDRETAAIWLPAHWAGTSCTQRQSPREGEGESTQTSTEPEKHEILQSTYNNIYQDMYANINLYRCMYIVYAQRVQTSLNHIHTMLQRQLKKMSSCTHSLQSPLFFH